MLVHSALVVEGIIAAAVEYECIFAVEDLGAFAFDLFASLQVVDAEESGGSYYGLVDDLGEEIAAGMYDWRDFGVETG